MTETCFKRLFSGINVTLYFSFCGPRPQTRPRAPPVKPRWRTSVLQPLTQLNTPTIKILENTPLQLTANNTTQHCDVTLYCRLRAFTETRRNHINRLNELSTLGSSRASKDS